MSLPHFANEYGFFCNCHIILVTTIEVQRIYYDDNLDNSQI